MRLNKHIKLFLFLILLTCNSLQAQIFPINTGYVVTIENGDNCFPIVVTEDRQIFEVVQSDLELSPGHNITFANVSTQTTSSCVLTNQVIIYVISENSTGNSADLCDYVDCVLPGDVNQDGVVDMVDMIMVHHNSGFTGLYRPNSSTDFEPQFSLSWNEETYFGNDLKHLDTDGNGIILQEDLDVVDQNYNLYTDIEEIPLPVLEGFYVNIAFEEEEIIVPDAFDLTNISTSAIINFHGSGQVLSNVSAVSFEIEHSDEDFLKTEDIVFLQTDPDFFETENEIPNKIFRQLSENQNSLDIAVSTLMPEGKTGIGRIGQLDFIIISDIIEARSEIEIPINIKIGDIKVHFNDGSIFTVDTNIDADQLTIVKETVTEVEDQVLEQEFTLSPNPVVDNLRLVMPEGIDQSLRSRINILNAAGVLVYSLNIEAEDAPVIDLESLESGVYLMELTNSNFQVRNSFIKL